MIHLYHGLFGSGDDWQGIIEDPSTSINHDLYDEDLQTLLALKTNPEDILIGYSMGGRMALEIAVRNSFNLKKIILISTHPGLREIDKTGRRIWEDQLLLSMRTLSPGEFCSFWNSLPLFQGSELSPCPDADRLKKSADLFESFRLSQTSEHFELLALERAKIIWINGDQDKKYQDLARTRIRPLGIKTHEVATDHRVLKDAPALKKILLSEGVI